MINHTKRLIGIILFVSVAAFSYAQSHGEAEKMERTDSLYFKSTSLFKCNIRLPEHYNTDSTYPLVIGLHGGGGTPDSFIKVWSEVEPVHFIYATPQGPYSIFILMNWVTSGLFGVPRIMRSENEPPNS